VGAESVISIETIFGDLAAVKPICWSYTPVYGVIEGKEPSGNYDNPTHGTQPQTPPVAL
jgi:hypothetical protein